MVFGRSPSPVPAKQSIERPKESMSAVLPKPKVEERNTRPLSQGRTGNHFLRQERSSAPRIRKNEQLIIPGEQQVTLSSDWSPKNQDGTLSYVNLEFVVC